MSSATETRCTVEVPFNLRFNIRLHTTEEHLEKATEHFQDPDREWAFQAERVVQRWLNQEIVPNLQGELHAIAPSTISTPQLLGSLKSGTAAAM